MANTNINTDATAVEVNTAELCGRFFETINNRIAAFIKEPKHGHQVVVFKPIQLPDGSISKIEWETVSHINMASLLKGFIEAMYPGVSYGDPRTCQVQLGYTLRLKEDISEGACDKYPFEIEMLDDVDCKGVTLKDYITDLCGDMDLNTGLKVLNITLQDFKDSVNNVTMGVTDLNSHIDLSKLTKEEIAVHCIKQDQDLYDSIEDTKDCKKLCVYLETPNPTSPHKLCMLIGGAGCGKTTLAEHVSHKYGIPCISITGDPSLTIEDICGYVVPNTDVEDVDVIREKLKQAYHTLLTQGGLTEEQIEAEFDKIIKNCSVSRPQWKTVRSAFLIAYTCGWLIIINEVNNFSLPVLIGLNDAFYGAHRAIRFQGQVIPAHEKTLIICTTNFGYQGNNPMNEAFFDRFYPFYMTDLVEDNYAKYLCKKFSNLEADGVKEYTKFMFKLMVYMTKTFEDQDKYSPATPSVSTRRFPELLALAINSKSLKQPLGDLIFAILHGVEDARTKTQGVLANFDKEIAKVEKLLFTSKQALKNASKMYKKFVSIGVAPSANSSDTTNDIEAILRRAKASGGASVEDAINAITGMKTSSLNSNWEE